MELLVYANEMFNSSYIHVLQRHWVVWSVYLILCANRHLHCCVMQAEISVL